MIREICQEICYTRTPTRFGAIQVKTILFDVARSSHSRENLSPISLCCFINSSPAKSYRKLKLFRVRIFTLRTYKSKVSTFCQAAQNSFDVLTVPSLHIPRHDKFSLIYVLLIDPFLSFSLAFWFEHTNFTESLRRVHLSTCSCCRPPPTSSFHRFFLSLYLIYMTKFLRLVQSLSRVPPYSTLGTCELSSPIYCRMLNVLDSDEATRKIAPQAGTFHSFFFSFGCSFFSAWLVAGSAPCCWWW